MKTHRTHIFSIIKKQIILQALNHLYLEKSTLQANIATIRLLTVTSRHCVCTVGLSLRRTHGKWEKRKGDTDKANIKSPKKNPTLNTGLKPNCCKY